MIERGVNKLVDAFVENQLITEEERERYIYSLVCWGESVLTIVALLGVGVVMGHFISVVCFCIFFFTLRKRTGGFHMPSFALCFICSMGIIIAVIYSVDILVKHMTLMWVILSGSVILIGAIRTVNHPDLNLNREEMDGVRESALWVLVLECIGIGFMQWMGIDSELIVSSALGICVCALLLVIAKLKQQEVKGNE